MTKSEIAEGFLARRQLTQEEWSTAGEIAAVDELIAEGLAEVVHDWEYKDNFQCSRRVVRGTGAPRP